MRRAGLAVAAVCGLAVLACFLLLPGHTLVPDGVPGTVARELPPSGSVVRVPYKQRIQDTLARFLHDWPEASTSEKAAMARFFAQFSYRAAVPVLRQESDRQDRESGLAALQALAALGDVSSIELQRRAVRTATDGETVRMAAAALGAWNDDHSYSTLLLSLMRPRCEGACVVAQVQSVMLLRHPFLTDLLLLVHTASSSRTARLAAGAALAPRARGSWWKEQVGDALQRELVFPDEEGGTPAGWDEQGHVLALWGLTRLDDETCKETVDRLRASFHLLSPAARPAQARRILAAAPPCLKSRSDKEDGFEGEVRHAASGASDRGTWLPPLLFAAAAAGQEPQWVDWLVSLSAKLSLWDETRSVQQFAEALEKMDTLRAERGLSRSEHLSVGSGGSVHQATPEAIEKTVTGFLPGPDFDTYEHPTGQPDWWPSWLDVTIDDGPRPRRLQAVLSVLDKWGVKGTFFFIGVNVAEQWTRRPDETRKTVQGMLDSGHRVGYHTMCHDTTWANHLQSWTPEQIADDIALFDLTMSAMLGHDFTPVYGRLPGGMGRKYAHVRHGFRLGGLKAPVHWTIDDEVWSLATSKSEIRKLARKIVESRKPTVILVHEYLGLDRQLEAFFETVHEEMVKKASSNP